MSMSNDALVRVLTDLSTTPMASRIALEKGIPRDANELGSAGAFPATDALVREFFFGP